MSERGTLEAVAHHLTLAMEPLSVAASDFALFRALLFRLGWDAKSLPSGWDDVAGAVDELLALLDQLGDELEPSDIQLLLDKVNAVTTAIDAVAQAPAGTDASFLADIASRLVQLLLVEYLSAYVPRAYTTLRALGIVKEEVHDVTTNRPAYVDTWLDFEEIPEIVSDPKSLPKRLYGWGTPDFRAEPLLRILSELALALGMPAYVRQPDYELATGYKEPTEDDPSTAGWMIAVPFVVDNIAGAEIEIGLAMLDLPAEGTKLPGLVIQPLLPSEAEMSWDLSDELKLRARAATNVAQMFGIVIRPGELSARSPFDPGAPLPSAGFGLGLDWVPAEPKVLLGSPGSTRLELGGGTASFDLATVGGELDFRLGFTVDGLAAVVTFSEQDGFLGKVLGGTDTRVPIPFELGWSNSRGLEFGASAGFEVTVAPHLQIGPISLEEVMLAVRASASSGGQPPTMLVLVGVSIAGELGPIAFAVEGIGVKLDVAFEDGNAGPFDIEVGFKPPKGVGLAVDASVVKGGGYLYFDFDNGEYAGVLELSIKDVVQVKAIGLLTTRMPGGQSGFSLLLIITAQFPPIQLSFGFVLTGVGGLIGVNRTMVIDVLRAGIRTRTLDSIMFPENPVKNAPKIISDLKAVFPPAERRFVFGPMIEIGWGSPALVFGRLGVLIELPEPIRIAILGQLKLALPEPDTAVVEINLDVLGILDFEKSSFSLDATIYDSRVAAFALSGDMAMRLVWAPQPNFALSIGGLNPRYQPPPAFPELRRLTLSLGESENPRLSLEAYTAITSNSVQFGAHLELYGEAGGFVLRGYFGFDALFMLSPFSFVVEMAAGVEVSSGGRVLMSIHLDFTLEGPTPWHAFGTASFKILFLKVSVGFDETFGDDTQAALPAADAKSPLLAALADARNWSASLPAAAERGATRGPGGMPVGAVLVHPLGRLGVRQTVAPLGIELTKFGSGVAAGANEFRISEARLNQTAVDREPVSEYFARGQYFELTDEQKVSGESFELMEAGANLGKATGLKRGPIASLDLDYETQLVENVVKPSVEKAGYSPGDDTFSALLKQGAAGLSGVYASGDAKYLEPGTMSKVGTSDMQHVVVSTDDLTLQAELTAEATNLASAEQALRRYLEAHPDEAGTLQVVPVGEAVTA